MPKMFKPRFFFFLIVLLPIWVNAQTQPSEWKITPDEPGTHSFYLTMGFRANARTFWGVAIRFSKQERVFPRSIVVDGEQWWLLNARSAPQKKKVVHWYYADSVLELRFSPQSVTAGSIWELHLHLSELSSKKKKIAVVLMALSAEGRTAGVLSKKTMPLPQNALKILR